MMALEDKVKWAQQVITRKDTRLQEVSYALRLVGQVVRWSAGKVVRCQVKWAGEQWAGGG